MTDWVDVEFNFLYRGNPDHLSRQIMFFACKVEEIEPDVGYGCAKGGRWGFCRAGVVLLAWSSFLALVTIVYHCFYIIGHSLPEVDLIGQC